MSSVVSFEKISFPLKECMEEKVREARSWNALVSRHGGSFLQSFEWGAFQEAFGRKVIRCEEGSFFGQAMIHRLLPGLSYAYVPRGPLGVWGEEPSFRQWLARFRRAIAAMDVTFVRLEPPDDADVKILTRNGFLETGRNVQPRMTLLVDLRRGEGEILDGMHEKTRYNIRLAKRHGVVVDRLERGERRVVVEILKETARRQRIRLHPERYYLTMMTSIPDAPSPPSSLPEGGMTQAVYVARYRGEILAGAIVGYFGRRATYLHGGMVSRHREVMASYALHWAIMEEAKEGGYPEYDFGGIDEERWPGLTRFKRGFGGIVEEHRGAYELPLNGVRYSLYRSLTKLIR